MVSASIPFLEYICLTREIGSGLTRKQRALMIIVIVLLVYIAFGALVNSFLLHLNFIDGLYFTVVTIETIGFGDIVPNNTGSRVFTCFYMAFGILNVGVAVAMTRETVLEGLELGYRKRLRNLQLRRREARRFRRWEARWRRAVEWRLKAAGKPVWVPDAHCPTEEVRFVGLHGDVEGAGEVHWMKRWLNAIGVKDAKELGAPNRLHTKGHPRGRHLNIDALEPQQLEGAALEAGVPLEMFLATPRERPAPQRQGSRRSGVSASAASGAGSGRGESFRRMWWTHRHPDTNGWPTYPQTPTHAQVGRMAAMVTKFAMAVTGTHVHMLGHSPETHPSRQREEDAEREAAPNRNVVFFDERRPQTDGASGSSRAGEKAEEQRSEGEGERKKEEPEAFRPAGHLVAEGTLHPNVPSWAKDLASGRNTKSGMLYEHLKEDMEAEESKAYWAKVCSHITYNRRLALTCLQLAVAWSLFSLFWLVRPSSLLGALEANVFFRSALRSSVRPKAGPTVTPCTSVSRTFF